MDSPTSRLGRHIAFISAGLWPVIYKWQGYIESLAWGVRLAKEDCVRRGLPIKVSGSRAWPQMPRRPKATLAYRLSGVRHGTSA